MDGLDIREIRAGPARAIIAQSAVIDQRLRDRVLELRSVMVPADKRGKGCGEKLLCKICSDADIAGNALFLMIDDTDSLGRLRVWYERHGFECVQTDPVLILVRKPQLQKIQH